jgi:Flp pilus assembly protein TadG
VRARRRALLTDNGDRGSAVVEFVLVSLLIMLLLLAVLQVAVYVHVRNVVTASAQEGARYAANARWLRARLGLLADD